MPGKEELNISLCEFLRYSVVGGVAFLVDFSVMVMTREFLWPKTAGGVYLAVICGFVAGLTINYALSLLWVFTRKEDFSKGRGWRDFFIFGLVGILGLGWTELGMWAGVAKLQANYMVVKIVVSLLVLLWNYLGRRILVFRR